MRTANSLEKTQMLGKIEGRRRRGQQRMRWPDYVARDASETAQAAVKAEMIRIGEIAE